MEMAEPKVRAEVRCEHGHLLALVMVDGKVVALHRDGCKATISPARISVVIEKHI